MRANKEYLPPFMNVALALANNSCRSSQSSSDCGSSSSCAIFCFFDVGAVEPLPFDLERPSGRLDIIRRFPTTLKRKLACCWLRLSCAVSCHSLLLQWSRLGLPVTRLSRRRIAFSRAIHGPRVLPLPSGPPSTLVKGHSPRRVHQKALTLRSRAVTLSSLMMMMTRTAMVLALQYT